MSHHEESEKEERPEDDVWEAGILFVFSDSLKGIKSI